MRANLPLAPRLTRWLFEAPIDRAPTPRRPFAGLSGPLRGPLSRGSAPQSRPDAQRPSNSAGGTLFGVYSSWWGLLTIPAIALVGFVFAIMGLAYAYPTQRVDALAYRPPGR